MARSLSKQTRARKQRGSRFVKQPWQWAVLLSALQRYPGKWSREMKCTLARHTGLRVNQVYNWQYSQTRFIKANRPPYSPRCFRAKALQSHPHPPFALALALPALATSLSFVAPSSSSQIGSYEASNTFQHGYPVTAMASFENGNAGNRPSCCCVCHSPSASSASPCTPRHHVYHTNGLQFEVDSLPVQQTVVMQQEENEPYLSPSAPCTPRHHVYHTNGLQLQVNSLPMQHCVVMPQENQAYLSPTGYSQDYINHINHINRMRVDSATSEESIYDGGSEFSLSSYPASPSSPGPSVWHANGLQFEVNSSPVQEGVVMQQEEGNEPYLSPSGYSRDYINHINRMRVDSATSEESIYDGGSELSSSSFPSTPCTPSAPRPSVYHSNGLQFEVNSSPVQEGVAMQQQEENEPYLSLSGYIHNPSSSTIRMLFHLGDSEDSNQNGAANVDLFSPPPSPFAGDIDDSLNEFFDTPSYLSNPEY